MRQTPALLLLFLCACAVPNVPALQAPDLARAAYPQLIPTQRILAQVPQSGARVTQAAASLSAEAAGLRRRATVTAAREQPGVSPAIRAANLRARADAMRGSALTEAERDALRIRVRALQAQIAQG